MCCCCWGTSHSQEQIHLVYHPLSLLIHDGVHIVPAAKSYGDGSLAIHSPQNRHYQRWNPRVDQAVFHLFKCVTRFMKKEGASYTILGADGGEFEYELALSDRGSDQVTLMTNALFGKRVCKRPERDQLSDRFRRIPHERREPEMFEVIVDEDALCNQTSVLFRYDSAQIYYPKAPLTKYHFVIPYQAGSFDGLTEEWFCTAEKISRELIAYFREHRWVMYFTQRHQILEKHLLFFPNVPKRQLKKQISQARQLDRQEYEQRKTELSFVLKQVFK